MDIRLQFANLAILRDMAKSLCCPLTFFYRAEVYDAALPSKIEKFISEILPNLNIEKNR